MSHTSAPQDKVVADAIVSRLEQAGIRCWVAPRDVIPGTVYAEAIIEAIAASRLMVVVLSGEANQSRHVHREVERAVANDVVIIPFRIESVEPSGAMAYYLASEHWLDAMTPPIEAHIARLADVVHVLLRRPVSVREGTVPGVVPPTQTGVTGRTGHVAQFVVLAACLVFAASVTLLTDYVNSGAGESLLKATTGDQSSPLTLSNFLIPVALAAFAFVVTLVSMGVYRRPLGVWAVIASFGLIGYTLYLYSQKGIGFSVGSSYWLSLAAAIAMAVGAGVTAARSDRRSASR